MKKILLITLIFILQSIPSFGNSIDGKGLVCKQIELEGVKKDSYEGFLFGDETFREFSFDRSNDEVRLKRRTTTDYYHTNKDQIWWRNDTHIEYVDRKTLNLIQRFYSDGREIHTHRCMVYENRQLFMKELHRIRHFKQKIYNESLRDNKI